MGMGHFFRMMNLYRELKAHEGNAIFVLVGAHPPAQQWLEREGIEHVVADEMASGWEASLIELYQPTVWINDRLATDASHVLRLKEAGLKVVTFDDTGSGAPLVDVHISALAEARGEMPAGKVVLKGVDYLIMPEEIKQYRRQRTASNNLIVCLGGSDTYGMTVKVAAWLNANRRSATLVLGPGFMHEEALKEVMTDKLRIERSPSSLVEAFSRHDMAVTGGGITAFEAAAAGLPTLTIANEVHEIGHCEYLQALGCSVYLGYREEAELSLMNKPLNVEQMSRTGMQSVGLDGSKNINEAIKQLNDSQIKENS
jgi:spore coat polysaccharide biosynthesis predicted glycosyltransferase SpsG